MVKKREKNIPYNPTKLDEVIRKIDGERYSRSIISTVILQHDTSYYAQCMKKGTMSESGFATICKFYKLKKSDYLLTDEELATRNAEKARILEERKKLVESAKNTDTETQEVEEIKSEESTDVIESVTDTAEASEMNITESPETLTVVPQSVVVEPTDLTPILNQLAELMSQFQILTKSLMEVIGEQRSIKFLLSQMTDRIGQHCKYEKDLLDKMEQNNRYRKNNNFNNSNRKNA